MFTRKQELQRIIREYRKSGEKWPASSREIAIWALENNWYGLARPTIEKHCARELAQAMREDYFTDSRGRRVRAKHPARRSINGQLVFLWDDIRTAPRSHMKLAFNLRRRRIVSECKQVKADVANYNDTHPEEPPIQMPLDFTFDVEELELVERENLSKDTFSQSAKENQTSSL